MNKEQMKVIAAQRDMMKTRLDDMFRENDQARGISQPPIDKNMDGKEIPLSKDFSGLKIKEYRDIIDQRTSRRKYTEESLSFEELSYLLWSTQGVKVIGKKMQATIRTVPSAGARHPLETYLFVRNVQGLEKGLYHYLPLKHSLENLGAIEDQKNAVTAACMGQAFVGNAAVSFAWTAIPYRVEWRYGANAHKFVLIDAGHICQNLYLGCEALGLGICGIGAYDQAQVDRLLGLPKFEEGDPQEELTVYMASVGRV